jgi:ferredoxin
MKAVIDKDACTGCGLCVETCPDVFEMADDVAQVKADPVPSGAEDSAKQAADDCPSEAIQIQD